MSNRLVYFKLMVPKPDPKIPTVLEITLCAKHDATFQALGHKLTESEFDGFMNHLIQELEQIRKEGRRHFLNWPWRRTPK
jgi:hypothetical protein